MTKDALQMPDNINAQPSEYVEITIPPREPVKICPFTDKLLAQLTAAFELRGDTSKWCGFAALEMLPEELSAKSKSSPSDTQPLCTVMFLKGADSKNFLLHSIDHQFLLLDDRFHLVHKCPSLSHILEQADVPPACH